MTKSYHQYQPVLFPLSDTTEGVVELFPEVWNALGLLISTNIEDRHSGYEKLIALNAHKLSPVVAYILSTCLDDDDIELRLKVVQTLGELLSPGDDGSITPPEVKKQIKFYLSKMRQRRVFALLQVAEAYPIAQSSVALLFKACSYAGNVLGDIFSDRRLPVEIRHQAIIFAGLVGFLDTVPRLEKLAEKLEARMNGQRSMPFAPTINPEESSLLPAIKSSLEILNSP